MDEKSDGKSDASTKYKKQNSLFVNVDKDKHNK